MSPTSLTDGLKAAYNFNGDAKDRSGNYNHGTVVGASPESEVVKLGSGAYSFNGISDHIRLELPTAFKSASVTYQGWIKPNAFGAFRYFMAGNPKGSLSVAIKGGVLLGVSITGKARFLIGTGGAGFIVLEGTSTLTTTEYHHIVATYDGAFLRIFVNGVYEAVIAEAGGINWSDSGDGPDPAQFYISGAHNDTVGVDANFLWFDGFVDEIALWDRALLYGGVAIGEYAGEEISELYNKGAGRELIMLPKGTATGKPVIDGQREPILSSTEQITGLSAVKGLTVPEGTRLVVIEAETQAVRWRDDGTDPSATVGMPLPTGVPKAYTGDFSAIKFKEQTPSAKLNISYYK